MAKVKQRKDSKGRVLQTGETQRKTDGMYIYRYVDPYGKRCSYFIKAFRICYLLNKGATNARFKNKRRSKVY